LELPFAEQLECDWPKARRPDDGRLGPR
jgi:hypothetical protein